MTELRNPSAKTRRGRPFERGNSGRPKGCRNKSTQAVETLLEGELEALTRKAVELALGGDVTALKLCLDRLCPTLKSRPVALKLPRIEGAADLQRAVAAVVDAVSAGSIVPDEAVQLTNVLETYRRALETVELDQRVSELEATAKERWR